MDTQKINKYDLIIIGGGSAGLTAAETAHIFDKKIALIAERIGGDCLWTGCVPSKALISSAKEAKLKSLSLEDAWKLARSRIDSTINTIKEEHDNKEFYENLGIDVYESRAKFVDASTIEVDGKLLTAKKFLVCTGSRARIPNIEGLESVPYITNENIFSLDKAPESITVIGGGPIGCELSQALQNLGCKVTLLQSDARLMPKDEPEASDTIYKELLSSGIDIKLNVTIKKVSKNNNLIEVSLDQLGTSSIVSNQVLLIAAGRQVNVEDLELEKAHIEYSPRGIVHNKYLQTSNKNVYVAGDVAGDLQFTHYASAQAGVAIQNMFVPLVKSQVSSVVPWCTYTSPEVAHVGLTVEMAKKLDIKHTVSVFDVHSIDRALADNKKSGFIQIVVDKNERILGSTIVCERAGEMIQEMTIAIDNKYSVEKLLKTIHAYPTYSSGIAQLLFYRYKNTNSLLLKIGKFLSKF